MFNGDQPHVCSISWLLEVGRQGESKQYLPLIPQIALPITPPWLSEAGIAPISLTDKLEFYRASLAFLTISVDGTSISGIWW